MKIASVQCKSTAGEVELNLSRHIAFINIAIKHKCDLVFFPELSLTNYEPHLAESLASGEQTPQFAILQTYADDNNIVICVGMPIRAAHGIQIGQMIFQPNKARAIYAKQILHADEYPFFVSGDDSVFIEIGEERLAPAICYESMLNRHVEAAYENGARVYLASVAKNMSGVERGNVHYSQVAKRFGIHVIMSNAIGPCDNFTAVGGSAVWNTVGECVATLDNSSEAVLIYDTLESGCTIVSLSAELCDS
ncbi:carbon-nitrogen hydrolase family protein [Agaribacter marinus]|uniref:Carbon-nitrogen hydrolase family protein n=1 Tax=Agaribacter marinus TaxID=1431249 RepID=A0AA37SUV8_9ALTE|nr:carbon-nitrogen hydrolase family protein [Agaribacter marinus]GLR70326.1 carbon-nitrogen hydrolase family protein [Agaribacter marinus]